MEDPVPNCFQVLQALRELLHLACHRRSLYFAELELDGKLSSISAAIQAVCRKRRRDVNAILGQTGARKISVKNYMSNKIEAVGLVAIG
jgi:hypothetical protein